MKTALISVAFVCSAALPLITYPASPPPKDECRKTFIKEPMPFLGNGGEIIILGDGSIWKDASYQYLYLYAYNPAVVICPSEGRMIIIEPGRSNSFQVTRVR